MSAICIVCCLVVCGVVSAAAQTASINSFTAEQLRLKGKKGIGFTLRNPGWKQAQDVGGTWDVNIPRVKMLDVSWNYSWGLEYVPVQPADIEFVPMVWGGGKDLGKWLETKLRPAVEEGKVKRLLGFNEPDHEEQSNVSYMKAIELWPDLMKAGVPLCSPSCANTEGIDDDSVQGVKGTWMRDFMNEAGKRGYRVDYIGTHWYGGTNTAWFKGKMRQIYEKYGKRPLLITEFAPADWSAKTPKANRHTPAEVLEFMKEVLPWLEKQDWIAGYAWFPFDVDSPAGTSSALFDKDGKLTACGRYYRSVTPDDPEGDRSIKPDPPL